jgi:hypothetical protein
MFLSGSGGCGKSHVVRAVLHWAELWQVRDRVLVTGSTGIAAANFGRAARATTVHSAAGMRGRATEMERQRADADALQDHNENDAGDEDGGGGRRRHRVPAVAGKWLLILDEVSMVGASLLADVAQKVAAWNPAQPGVWPATSHFGATHVVLVGDMFQLPPVLAVPLYASDGHSRESAARDRAKVRVGVEIWRNGLNAIVVLRKTERQAGDQPWGRLLDKMRVGEINLGMMDEIGGRVLGCAPRRRTTIEGGAAVSTVVDAPTMSDVPAGTTVVTPSNDERRAWNALGVVAYSLTPAAAVQRVLRLPAVFSPATSRSAPLDLAQLRRLYALTDNALGWLPPYLDVFPGMPVMVTSNVNQSLGLANGTVAALERVVWDVERPEFTTVQVPMGTHVVSVDIPRNGRPTGLLLRLPGETEVLKKGWRRGCVVLGLSKLQQWVALPALGDRHGGASFSVTVSQFPVLPRMACTGHKVQAMSMDTVLVPRWKGATGQWGYVVLSRVRRMGGLFMLEAPDTEFWRRAKPGAELVKDTERIQRLDAAMAAMMPPTAAPMEM